MSKTSVFNIKIDFDKSQDSYIFDKNTNKKYLDFMGMYSSLPLGYNHKIFSTNSFKKEINRISKLKLVNCEILSDEFNEFYNSFKLFTKGDNYHFTCTGALANEAAIKAAMWYKGPNPKGYVLSIENSFHGINSVGNLITTRFNGVDLRLGKIPGKDFWPKVKNINEAIKYISTNKDKLLQGIIIEPIQATYGDNYFNKESLKKLRETCTQYDIPLIFDEVQTGFCSTGKVWYSEHLGIEPDIITFGKKSQVSGIMVKSSHSKVFEIPKRLSVTFDGDLIDMVRCKYIIKAINKDNLLKNASQIGKILFDNLKKIKNIKNVRSIGLLLAFDFDNTFKRDRFVKKLYNKGMICNPTGDRSIRLRPNLSVKKQEVEKALNIIRSSVE
jgi:L-lysine 6-transaminase